MLFRSNIKISNFLEENNSNDNFIKFYNTNHTSKNKFNFNNLDRLNSYNFSDNKRENYTNHFNNPAQQTTKNINNKIINIEKFLRPRRNNLDNNNTIKRNNMNSRQINNKMVPIQNLLRVDFSNLNNKDENIRNNRTTSYNPLTRKIILRSNDNMNKTSQIKRNYKCINLIKDAQNGKPIVNNINNIIIKGQTNTIKTREAIPIPEFQNTKNIRNVNSNGNYNRIKIMPKTVKNNPVKNNNKTDKIRLMKIKTENHNDKFITLTNNDSNRYYLGYKGNKKVNELKTNSNMRSYLKEKEDLPNYMTIQPNNRNYINYNHLKLFSTKIIKKQGNNLNNNNNNKVYNKINTWNIIKNKARNPTEFINIDLSGI